MKRSFITVKLEMIRIGLLNTSPLIVLQTCFKIRPIAEEFLMKMAKHFEIVILIAFTAGHKLTIVQELDPTKTAIVMYWIACIVWRPKTGSSLKI